MKILIVNTEDFRGGAAKAAYRLHSALKYKMIDSKMLVLNKTLNDDSIISLQSNVMNIKNTVNRILNNLILKLYPKRIKMPFSPSIFASSDTVKKINAMNPDIVHIHWIGGAFMKFSDLCKIKAPIVMSLHDTLAFTGGCHYTWNCSRNGTGCGRCPQLSSINKYDITAKNYKKKQKIYKSISNLNVVGLSSWITNEAISSKIFNNKKIVTLPNPIDTEIYKPVDKNIARTLLNIPLDKKIILFGAMYATSDIRKGFKELHEAVIDLENKDLEIVIFGSSKPTNPPDFGFPVHYTGVLYDELTLCLLYSASDVTIVPSLHENLSNTIMESLACGTPVVAFDIGGNKDMIAHKKNGYLAKPYEPIDLRKGIDWVLDNIAENDSLSIYARNQTVKKFDKDVIADFYINLYKQILSETI